MNGPANPVTIVLADDHPLVLSGLEQLLEGEGPTYQVSTFANGNDALDAIRSLRPSLAILDVSMPGRCGLDVLAEVRRARLATRVILLAASLEDNQIFDAVSAGVDGLILKNSAPDLLLTCVESVQRGRRWLPRDFVEPALARESERRALGRQVVGSLTAQERTVALLIAEGLVNKIISRRLGITEGTVKIHLHNIYSKLGVANRTELAAIAIRHADQLRARPERAGTVSD